MIDIFKKEDIISLLKHKTIVFMGDSNVRAVYKDFLCLLNKNQIIPVGILKKKMEDSVFGDRLVNHGRKYNGRDYREERSAKIKNVKLSYYFLTKVYDGYVKHVLDEITSHSSPDIVVMNSLVWDITRWGSTGADDFKHNLKTLMSQIKSRLPHCLFIWLTAPPVSAKVLGGFLIKELQFLEYSLRYHVMEANHYSAKVVSENGFDVLDTHYHLKMQIHRRFKDGIHWNPPAVRYITNLLLTHISIAIGVPLPNRYQPETMEENLQNLLETPLENVKDNEAQEHVSKKTKCVASENVCSQGMSSQDKRESSEAMKMNNRRPSLERYVPKMSAHSYTKQVDLRQRLQRIRRWKHSSPGNPTHSSTPYRSTKIHQHHIEEHLDQSDSGICSSPTPNFTFSYKQGDSGYFSPSHIPHRSDSYYNSPRQIPLPREPYPFTAHNRYQDRALPLNSNIYAIQQPVQNYSFKRNLQSPYPFPQVDVNQTLQPTIDFTSDRVDINGYYF